MKKTMRRGIAKAMYEALIELPLGYLELEDLEKVMNNMVALSVPYDYHNKLMGELGKRLYADIDVEDINKFNSMITLANKADSVEKTIAVHRVVESKYPDIYKLLSKQVKVENYLLEREVEVDIDEIDRKAFIKAILQGKPDIKVSDFDLFNLMFTSEDNSSENLDFSELDELLKE